MASSTLDLRHTFLIAAALLACSPTEESPRSCTVAMIEQGAADLELQGTGSCATTLTLHLRVATGSPASPTWYEAAASPVQIGGRWSSTEGGALREVVLRNTSGAPVTVVGLEWSLAAGELALPVDRMLHNGYQSWSDTGVEAVPAAMDDRGGTAPHGGEDGNVLGEQVGVSWWWSFVSDASGRGVVLGADGGTVLKTYVAVDGAESPRVRLVQGMTGDAIVLEPGADKHLDGLYLALGDVRSRLDAYAARVAELHATESRRPSLGGWGSWNLYYEDIDADALRVEASWASETLVPLGLPDFLLDDGYEPHWGEWIAAPAFGAELDTLAAEQDGLGLKPAIWLAPFYVSTDDPVVNDNPAWFVHDADGELRIYDNLGPTYAALEPTHPEARARVIDALLALRAGGYRSFKLDFLFGGSLEGSRDPPLTSLEAYALWMSALREALPDAHIIACGAPLLPSVGWVDSFRSGPDIAYTPSPEPRHHFIAAQARHTALRGYTDAWWSLDPDVLLLRGDGIDDVEAWTAVVSAAMAGGNYMLGDGRQAGALRLAMATAPEILALTRDGRAARARDLTAAIDPKLYVSPLLMGSSPTAVPHVWDKEAADGGRHYLAVFGWDDGSSTKVELPAGAEELLPPSAAGEGIARAAAGGSHTIDVAPRAARLFVW